MFTMIGKNDTMTTTTTLVASPRPTNRVISGATAVTGAERNTITRGIEVLATALYVTNAIASPTAREQLTISPRKADNSEKAAGSASVFRRLMNARPTASAVGGVYGGMSHDPGTTCHSAR